MRDITTVHYRIHLCEFGSFEVYFTGIQRIISVGIQRILYVLNKMQEQKFCFIPPLLIAEMDLN